MAWAGSGAGNGSWMQELGSWALGGLVAADPVDKRASEAHRHQFQTCLVSSPYSLEDTECRGRVSAWRAAVFVFAGVERRRPFPERAFRCCASTLHAADSYRVQPLRT